MKNNEYPENREWKQKAFGMPKLPSGDIGQDKVLYYILKMVKDGKSANTMLNIEGSNSTATLGRMCEWIRPIGLVNKEKQVWTLTELEKWFWNDRIVTFLRLFSVPRLYLWEKSYSICKNQKTHRNF